MVEFMKTYSSRKEPTLLNLYIFLSVMISRAYEKRQLLVNVMKMMKATLICLNVKEMQFVVMVLACVPDVKQTVIARITM